MVTSKRNVNGWHMLFHFVSCLFEELHHNFTNNPYSDQGPYIPILFLGFPAWGTHCSPFKLLPVYFGSDPRAVTVRIDRVQGSHLEVQDGYNLLLIVCTPK